MLGLIILQFESFIETSYSASVWKTILEASEFGDELVLGGCPITGGDASFYRLVASTAEVIGISEDQVLSDYGRHFVLGVSNEGYGKLLSSLGSTLVEFMSNLNNLHLFLSLGHSHFMAPEFRVDQVTRTSLQLHYSSRRPGLGPLVEGLVMEVARTYFDQEVQIKLLKGRADGSSDHEVFLVTYTDQDVNEEAVTPHAQASLYGSGSGSHCPYREDASRAFCPAETAAEEGRTCLRPQCSSSVKIGDLAPYIVPDASTFLSMNPFHFVLDEKCNVVQVGHVLLRLIPNIMEEGSQHIDSHMAIRHPYVGWDLSSILKYSSTSATSFLLVAESGLELKGQFLRVGRNMEMAMFVGSPRLSCLQEMQDHGIYMGDIQPHDLAADFVLLAEQRKLENNLKTQFEKETGRLVKEALKLEDEKGAAEQANTKLQEDLVAALGIKKDYKFRSLSPADLALTLMDSILRGEPIDRSKVIQARAAFLNAGQELHRPINFNARSMTVTGNDDVNRSLAAMLLPATVIDVDDELADDLEELAVLEEEFVKFNLSRDVEFRSLVTMISDRISISGGHCITKTPTVGEPASDGANLVANQNEGAATSLLRISGVTELAAWSQVQSAGGSVPEVEVTALNPASKEAQKPSTLLQSSSQKQFSMQQVKRVASRIIKSFKAMGSKSAPSDIGAVIDGLDVANGSQSALGKVSQQEQQGQLAQELLSVCCTSFSPQGSPLVVPPVLSFSGRPERRASENAPRSSMHRIQSHAIVRRHSSGMLDPQPKPCAAPPHVMRPSLPIPAHLHTWPSLASSPESLAVDLKAHVVMSLAITPSDKLATALSTIDEWQFDTFALDEASQGRALSVLAFVLIKRADLPMLLKLDERKLARFLVTIEDGYRANPYHSSVHAADVLRTLHVIVMRCGMIERVVKTGSIKLSMDDGLVMATRSPYTSRRGSTSEVPPRGHGYSSGHRSADNAHDSRKDTTSAMHLLMLYITAVIHDYDHRGVTNDFLARSSNPLALLYNDLSPNENHHVSAALTLMCNDELNFMKYSSQKAKTSFRQHVIDMVLGTDMKQHFTLMGAFSGKLAKSRESTAESSSILPPPLIRSESPKDKPVENDVGGVMSFHRPKQKIHCSSNLSSRAGSKRHSPDSSSSLLSTAASRVSVSGLFSAPPLKDWDQDMRELLFKMVLKCADLGHLTSPSDVHKKWVSRLEEELFRQGDAEKAAGFPVSPLMDRDKTGVTKSQTGFFNIVALPMYVAFAQAYPIADAMRLAVEKNLALWVEGEAFAGTEAATTPVAAAAATTSTATEATGLGPATAGTAGA